MHLRREPGVHDARETPPNAIVFGTGLAPLQRMLHEGSWLNLAGIAVITALAWLWFGLLLGVFG